MEKRIIDLEIIDELEGSGVDAIALVDSPAIEKNFMYFKAEEFVEPTSGESQSDYMGRCVPVLIGEGKDQDQAVAICISTYENMALVDNVITCDVCGHSWSIADGGDDIYICHKCGHDNEMEIMNFESLTDYPEAAKENAKRALAYAEENGWGDCGTAIGKARANQLANGEPISIETVARMASFERHRQNSKTPYGEGCGKLMWDAWGGDEGVAWAQKTLEASREEFEINTGGLAPYTNQSGPLKRKAVLGEEFASEEYPTIEEAVKRSEELGLKGEIHSHATDNGFIYMPGASHADLDKALAALEMAFAERPISRIPKEERGRTGSAKNKEGDTKTSRGGIEVSQEVESTLKDKIKEHNEKNPQDSQKADLGMLKAVWRRGSGAYSVGTPGRKGMGRNQWAMGRVNAFLRILSGSAPSDKDYKQDNDLLPKSHPKHSEQKMSKYLFADEDKKEIVGIAMVPDMQIPRKDKDGNIYFVRFSKKVIAKIAEKYMREQRLADNNIQHVDSEDAGSYIFESWIVESADDKANTVYGLDAPIGSWAIKMRVTNLETWAKVKAGELRGFSIQGNFLDQDEYEAYMKDRKMYSDLVNLVRTL